MKRISVIGSPGNELKTFILELGWVLSREHEVCCFVDAEVYDRYSIEGTDLCSFGGFTLIKNFEDIEKNEADILITDVLFENSNVVIYTVEQNPYSTTFLENFINLDIKGQKYMVFLNFLDSAFDEDYFKKFQLNKKLLENIVHEEVILFDEEVRRLQIENLLNRVISLKNYPKRHKQKLLNLASKLSDKRDVNYKEFYKELDKRVSLC